MSERNISFEIVEYLGVISRYDSGWNKELNLISWNGGAAKYDIRDWDAHHERMSKGLTLYADEMRRLTELYLADNSRKAVERGRAFEAERRERREEQKKAYRQTLRQNDGQVGESSSEEEAFAAGQGAEPEAEAEPATEAPWA